MPPSAASNRPVRRPSAPVNAPRSWPNSSLSISPSGSAPQLTCTNEPRPLAWCRARATQVLPVPVSPVISTCTLRFATRRSRSSTSSMGSERPSTVPVMSIGETSTARESPATWAAITLRPTRKRSPSASHTSPMRCGPSQVPLVLRRSRNRTAPGSSRTSQWRALTSGSSRDTSHHASRPISVTLPSGPNARPVPGPSTTSRWQVGSSTEAGAAILSRAETGMVLPASLVIGGTLRWWRDRTREARGDQQTRKTTKGQLFCMLTISAAGGRPVIRDKLSPCEEETR